MTYLARMRDQRLEIGVGKTLESAFDEAVEYGALEVFLFDANFPELIHRIGAREVYNILKVAEHYGGE